MIRHASKLYSDQHWLVAIGASGRQGFLDIDLLLSKLPFLPDATFLVVLHRRSDQVSMLAQVIGRHASMPVVVAVDGGGSSAVSATWANRVIIWRLPRVAWGS